MKEIKSLSGESHSTATVLSIDGNVTILRIFPLESSGAFFLLGTTLDPSLESKIAEVTHSQIQFALLENAEKSAHTLAKDSLILHEGPTRSLIAKVRLDTAFMESLYFNIQKGLLLTGAISLMVLIILIYLLLDAGFVRRFRINLSRIDQVAKQLREGRLRDVKLPEGGIQENRKLARSFNHFSSALVAYDQKAREQADIAAKAQKEVALAKMARQVSHDIRSPLTALEMFSGTLDDIPEETRVAMRGAIARISDIANRLLSQTRSTEDTGIDTPGANAKSPSPHLVSSLIEALATEKRMQYRDRIELEIVFEPSEDAYGQFANIVEGDFKRVLSNIIDNAVDSIEGAGLVTLEVTRGREGVLIRVADTGCGIPTELFPRLGERGFTHGRPNGSGLGPHFAFSKVSEWGGQIEIQSQEDRGTQVELELPTTQPPEWFVPVIQMAKSATVVVLDDDPSIHRVWRKRFQGVSMEGVQPTLKHFHSAEKLLDWHKKRRSSHRPTLFLCDFELIGQKTNGLEVIESLGIERDSILVTSRYEETSLREACSRLGVRMIPKALATIVPLQVQDEEDRSITG